MGSRVVCTLFQGHGMMTKSSSSVGDVLRTLWQYAQSTPSQATWEKLSLRAQTIINQMHDANRPPYVPHSVLARQSTTICDLFFDSTAFGGIRKDEQYATTRVGWNNPACFVVDLGRPTFTW